MSSVVANSSAESRFLASSNARTANLKDAANLRASELSDNAAASENVAVFLKGFNATFLSCTQIFMKLGERKVGVTAKERNSVLDILDELRKTGNELRNTVASASHFLQSYDVRNCEMKIEEVLRGETEARMRLAPREKFTFKSRRRNADVEVGDTNSSTCKLSNEGGSTKTDLNSNAFKTVTTETEYIPFNSTASVNKSSYNQENFEGFADKQNTTLTKIHEKGTPFYCGDFRLKSISNSTIVLLDVFGAVRLQDLQNCTVYLGPIAGSCYVEHCKNCVIFSGSRQLRIHECYDVRFNVHVVSGPIIEVCKGLIFGPYSMDYDEKLEMMAAADFGPDNEVGRVNAYKEVKDFKWLKNMKSPNWDLIDEGAGGVKTSLAEEYVTVTTPAAKLKKVRDEEERAKVEAEAKRGEEGDAESSEDEL